MQPLNTRKLCSQSDCIRRTGDKQELPVGYSLDYKNVELPFELIDTLDSPIFLFASPGSP